MYLMSIPAHPGKEKTAFQHRLTFHIAGEGPSNNLGSATKGKKSYAKAGMAKNPLQAMQGNPLISMGSDFAFPLWPETYSFWPMPAFKNFEKSIKTRNVLFS